MTQNDVGDFVAKRTGMLVAGSAFLCFLTRSAPPSQLRNSIATSQSVAFLGVMAMGIYEFGRGYAGAPILTCILIEAAVAAAFWNTRTTIKPKR